MTSGFRFSLLLLALLPGAISASQEAPPAQPASPPAAAAKPAGPSQSWKAMTQKEQAEALKSPAFSERVAQAALDQLLDGFQDMNPVRVMGVFDRDKLADYAILDDRVHSMMIKYNGFRGFFHVVSASGDAGRGSATATVQFEKLSYNGSTASDRRNGQVHIQMERGPRGWKIVSFEPRGFFLQ